jgi:uncharacterized membrane protein YfhO
MSKKNKKSTDFVKANKPSDSVSDVISKGKESVEISSKVGNGFLDKYALYIALSIITFIAFFVYNDFIFFKKLFLFKDIGSDTLNIFYPNGYLQSEYFHKKGIPSWSFQSGMGQSIMPFCLSDFFNIIFYLFDSKHFANLIIVRELLKLLFIALSFYSYLKLMKISNVAAIYGCIIVCFSGYFVLGGSWYIFSYDLFCVTFMLYALEKAISKSNFFVIPFAVFFIAISQPFNLYIFSLFFFSYVILRLYQNHDTIETKKVTVLFSKIVLFGIVGFLFSMPFFLENFFQMLESPRGSGEASYANTLKAHSIFGLASGAEIGTNILRFFSNDTLGTGSDFRGYNNYLEAGIFYIGIPTLLLVPQLFSFLSKKAKIIFGAILFIWMLPMFFPYMRYALWLFVGDYYRSYSLIVTVLLAIYGVFALDNIIKNKNRKWLILVASVVVLMVLSSISYFPDNSIVNKNILNTARFLIIIYAIIVLILNKIENKTMPLFVFFAILVAEVTYMSKTTINKRDILTVAVSKEKTGYNDYSQDAIGYIKNLEKSTFYRVDKTFGSSPAIHSSLNDAMLHNYNSTTSYSSFNQKFYINYLQATGVIEKNNESSTRWSPGIVNRTLLQSLNSVKYLLVKENKNPNLKFSHDSLATFGNISVLRNKFILPLGYTYSNYLSKTDFEKMSLFQRDYFLLNSFFVDDNDLPLLKNLNKISAKDSIPINSFTLDVYQNAINTLKTDTLSWSHLEETLLQGQINTNTNKLVYLSIPYDKGWHLKINGNNEKIIKVNAGMTGILLPKGKHNIELSYQLPYFYKGLVLLLIGVFLYTILYLFRAKLPYSTIKFN